jgi:hypothetical protein
MSDLLIILNPRRIEECLSAFRALPIDKLWIRNMTEYQIAGCWPEILERSKGYDRLIVQSDDGIVRPHALAEIIRLLDEHPVVTGYSNLSSTDFRVNITRSPQAETIGTSAYDLYTLPEVMEAQADTLPTFLVALCITGMAHEMWGHFPFRTYFDEPPGNGSDFCLSRDLHAAGVPMVAARDAFVWHVKERWNTADLDPRKRLYLHEPSELVLEKA